MFGNKYTFNISKSSLQMLEGKDTYTQADEPKTNIFQLCKFVKNLFTRLNFHCL